MAKLISQTYGEALFELAVEKNKVEEFLEEVEGIRQILKVHPQLTEIFLNPQITRAEKEDVLVQIFTGRISEEIVGFLRLVLEKGRYQELDRIFAYFIDRVKAYKKIGVAHVTTAIPLSGAQKQRVEDKLLSTTAFETMEISYQVDEALIGGMIIKIGDRTVDSSLRTKLENMQRSLMKVQLS